MDRPVAYPTTTWVLSRRSAGRDVNMTKMEIHWHPLWQRLGGRFCVRRVSCPSLHRGRNTLFSRCRAGALFLIDECADTLVGRKAIDIGLCLWQGQRLAFNARHLNRGDALVTRHVGMPGGGR